MRYAYRLSLAAVALLSQFCFGQPKPAAPVVGPGDAALRDYFRVETEALAKASLADIRTAADWDARKAEARRQLAEMLGLDPEPAHTDLKPVVTGKVDHPQFTVENLHFQSRPGLYVTGNLYIPKGLNGPAPTILYVCGHGTIKKDGVAYGAKAKYQHWGPYFARAGYVCLIIDTLELGEIEGLHHGTYREKMWWWHDRGYTPAGVEAWNSIRALDYLETRPEVDKTKFGVTGRSGGGAYSWWLATLDGRVKVAVPTAGITDLRDHVINGTVEGHCDCMFMVNTYRWDFGQVAALVAPRPLLIQNSDKDTIFPLEGVVHVHGAARGIYDLTKSATKNLGLVMTEGPHKDTQELQVTALKWFNRHFKGLEEPIELQAKPLFEPEQLRVFKELPADQINTKIYETFVAAAPPPKAPADKAEWETMRAAWMRALAEKSFGGWPRQGGELDVKPDFTQTAQGVTLSVYDFTSQHAVRLRLHIMHAEKLAEPDLLVLNVLDDASWQEWFDDARTAFSNLGKPPTWDATRFHDLRQMLVKNKWVMAYVAPRGVGPTAYTTDEKKRTQILRRYALLGQTLDGMRVWDARRAIQAVRALPQFAKTPLWLQGERQMAGVVLYASLFEPDIVRLDLHDLPRTHADGPHLLNVLKTLDIPAAVAMAAQRSRVVLYQADKTGWEYPQHVARRMAWKVELRSSTPQNGDANE